MYTYICIYIYIYTHTHTYRQYYNVIMLLYAGRPGTLELERTFSGHDGWVNTAHE